MSIPKAVTDTITALRGERTPLAARLDAIDLAIDNLSRVYGLHGTPQPLPLEPRAKGGPKLVRRAKAGSDDSEAAARRDVLLTAIGRSEFGLTLAELRKHTPKMDGKDRSNALQALKALGKIRRVGNTWKAAA